MTPVDIVTQGKWTSAFFTTYALSLSFFESQILKGGLSRNGCRNIQILSDVDGYAMSLTERQSQRVGTEYRLTPVALSNGVFHPKVSYLSSEEDDVLLIGSGNLTFGGFGRNVECLEAFTKSNAPQIFRAFAEMLEALDAREDLKASELAGLPQWHALAAQNLTGAVAQFPNSPAFLHSTNQSIGEQVIELVNQIGKVSEVRSLSPFYCPDAKGILKFSEALSSPQLTIGLLDADKHQTSFPFPDTRNSKVRIQAGLVECLSPARPLHAKWLEIELETGEVVIVSGSVNATNKSLMTSDNIECAIIRVVSKDSPYLLKWTLTDIPTQYERQDYQKAGLKKRVYVHGTINQDGSLYGRILCRDSPEGQWMISLSLPDGFTSEDSAEVDAHGQFKLRPKNVEIYSYATGIQITASKGEHSGSGWVQVESWLQASKRSNLSPIVMMRLMGSVSDVSDDVELLRYLSISAQKHLPAFSKQIPTSNKTTTQKADQEDQDERIHISALNSHSGPLATDLNHNGNQSDIDKSINLMIGRLRERLIQRTRESSTITTTKEVDTSEPNDESTEPENKELINAYDRFQSEMRELASQLKPGPERSSALCMWIEVTQCYLLDRLNQPENLEPFLLYWLGLALKGQTLKNSEPALAYNILSSLAVLAALKIHNVGEQHAVERLSSMHEQAAHYIGESVTLEDFESIGVFEIENAPLAAQLLTKTSVETGLHEAVGTMLAIPTVTQQVQTIKDTLANGADRDQIDNLPLWLSPAGKALKSFTNSGQMPPVLDKLSNSNACPHCYINPTTQVTLNLERFRFAHCPNCSKFIKDSK